MNAFNGQKRRKEKCKTQSGQRAAFFFKQETARRPRNEHAAANKATDDACYESRDGASLLSLHANNCTVYFALSNCNHLQCIFKLEIVQNPQIMPQLQGAFASGKPKASFLFKESSDAARQTALFLALLRLHTGVLAVAAPPVCFFTSFCVLFRCNAKTQV